MDKTEHLNVWPAPQRLLVTPHQVEHVTITGGTSIPDALRALAAWMDETGRRSIVNDTVRISYSTLATYATATFDAA